VESWGWYCEPNIFAEVRPKEPISSDLSRVSALVYYAGHLEDNLMATGSIRRVWIPDEQGDNAVVFIHRLGDDARNKDLIGLTCIILNKFDKLEMMVTAKPWWFKNLQHIGTLRIDSSVSMS